MIVFKKVDMNSTESQLLLQELNLSLKEITGDNGTSHFHKEEMNESRSLFMIGYIDEVPMTCGALRKVNQKTGEIKRVYARKNTFGLAHKLIKELEKEAKKLGYEELVLETRKINTHAVQFYLSLGYTLIPNYGIYQKKDNACCFHKLLVS